MPEITDWTAVLLALGSCLACGAYLYRVMGRLREQDEDAEGGGSLLTDIIVIAALVLFTVYQIKEAFLPLLD